MRKSLLRDRPSHSGAVLCLDTDSDHILLLPTRSS